MTADDTAAIAAAIVEAARIQAEAAADAGRRQAEAIDLLTTAVVQQTDRLERLMYGLIAATWGEQ